MDDTAKPPQPLPFAQILGHDFKHEELLTEALTHPSAIARRGGKRRHYERLEFLGDRVLGLVVADLLWRRFADEAEGELTRRHAHLVRREALAEVAHTLGLGRYLIVSPSEDAAGVRDNPRVLADVCEAVIAALFLDGGLEVATRFVARWWEARLAALGAPPRDPKTALQEWAQGRGLPLPVYRTVPGDGPAHRRIFTVTVRVEGLPPASATGSSKRAAETAAAAAALAALDAKA
ncbi:MAG TPA: ribonuclease III [Stellaceae bacterium]|nr:ribonuclease III [Stellaceae bacterium]